MSPIRIKEDWKNPNAHPILPLLRRNGVTSLVSNTRRERNDDADIDDLHDPCHVFDRSNLHARRQTLARVLSLKTNVTTRHILVSQNR
jgi:hypothetical protein